MRLRRRAPSAAPAALDVDRPRPRRGACARCGRGSRPARGPIVGPSASSPASSRQDLTCARRHRQPVVDADQRPCRSMLERRAGAVAGLEASRPSAAAGRRPGPSGRRRIDSSPSRTNRRALLPGEQPGEQADQRARRCRRRSRAAGLGARRGSPKPAISTSIHRPAVSPTSRDLAPERRDRAEGAAGVGRIEVAAERASSPSPIAAEERGAM